MMSLRVWLPGPMFLVGGLYLWSHVPSKGSLSGGSLSRESLSRESLSRESLSRGSLSGGLCRGVSVRETPPNRDNPPELGEWAVRILLECFLV